jgi:hypothetical protein
MFSRILREGYKHDALAYSEAEMLLKMLQHTRFLNLRAPNVPKTLHSRPAKLSFFLLSATNDTKAIAMNVADNQA